mgnify:CR=1 FL=1
MQNKNKLVSCIITTCKRGQLLSRAIESVLNQTYKNIEVIVIDDCPCEETRKIMNKYLIQHHNIIYIQNENNLGPSGARNKGVFESKGEFIAFLDDDDEWLPEKIESQMQFVNIANIVCNPPYFRQSNDEQFNDVVKKNQSDYNKYKTWKIRDL